MPNYITHTGNMSIYPTQTHEICPTTLHTQEICPSILHRHTKYAQLYYIHRKYVHLSYTDTRNMLNYTTHTGNTSIYPTQTHEICLTILHIHTHKQTHTFQMPLRDWCVPRNKANLFIKILKRVSTENQTYDLTVCSQRG